VNIADAIAYNNHDVDDGFRAGLLELDQLCEQPLFGEHYAEVHRKWPDLEDRRLIYEVIRRMIGHVVTDLIDNTSSAIAALAPKSIDDVRQQEKPVVSLSEGVLEMHAGLKKFLRENLYRHEQVRSMNEETQNMIELLFERYMSDTGQMPESFSTRAAGDKSDRARAVADYIAGMTDRFAIAEHERLTSA